MKEEECLDFTDVTVPSTLSRREFLKIGGGIFVFLTIGGSSIAEAQRRRGRLPSDFNAFLRVGEDGRVTCFTGKIEMGQGVITSIPQSLADELDVSLESIDMVMGDTNLCPYDRGTSGSRTTRSFVPALRAAAAEARAVLMELAAGRLKVTVHQLKVEDGVVFDKTDSKNKVTYAQLTKGKRIEKHLDGEAKLKDISEFKVVGKPFLRRDSLEKVTGEAKFAGDIRLPSMLYAKILRPPAHDAKLKRVDTSGAEKMEGVQVVRDGNLVAVLHQLPDVVEEAVAKIKAEYERPEPKVDDKSIFDHLLKAASENDTLAEGGNLTAGKKLSEHIFEAEYLNSYVAHAPLETHTAVANIEGNKVTVWASTQAPFRVKDQVAEALGFPPENVRIIAPFVGGGFGGKTRCQQGIEAACLAKLTGKPVQVEWSRAEEFFYDTFRPAAEEIHFKGGEILDRNFDTYEITRFSWTPEIETVLIDSDAPSQGGGEPAIICMGGVIANAIFDATGARLYQLPMTPTRIKEVMQRG